MPRTVIGAHIELRIEGGCELRFIDADAINSRPLVILAANARDAMDGKGQLVIHIEETEEVVVALRPCTRCPTPLWGTRT